MNDELTRPIGTLFVMHPEQIPDPNGMTMIFYQRFWDVLKEDVIRIPLTRYHSIGLK